MTENIGLSATTVTQTLDPVMLKLADASQARVDRADKPATPPGGSRRGNNRGCQRGRAG